MTLFDHNTAQTRISCERVPTLDVLLLESPLTLRTEDYHRLPRRAVLMANADALGSAWRKVQRACLTNDPALLGEAASQSAMASQTLLPKPGFNSLMGIVERCDLYGLNVAHSGSIVGLFLDRQRHDLAKVRALLSKPALQQHWPQQHLLRMVEGGVRER